MGRLGPPWHYEHWGTQSASADVADEIQPRIFKHQKKSEHINIYKHQSFRVFNQNFQPFSFKHQSILKPSGCSSPASASAALSHRFLPGVSNGRYQLRFRHFKFRQFVDSSMWAVPSLFAHIEKQISGSKAHGVSTRHQLNIWTIGAWRAGCFFWAARFGADFYFNLPRLWQFSVSALVAAWSWLGYTWSVHGDKNRVKSHRKNGWFFLDIQ